MNDRTTNSSTTDLDYVDGMSPHGHAIGLQLIEKTGNTSRFRLPYGEHLVGDPDTGVIHGGVITAMLDNACGHAVRSENEEITIATLDLRIDYMGPATPGETLFSEAECYKRTRNVAFVRARAFHQGEETPVATCVASFMLDTPSERRS